MSYMVVCADVIHWAETYTGPKFHALLTDCPYEMSFMSKKWDGSGISFQPETWAALAEHLLPGAFGMAFASARGWHRLAVAIEDAGLIFHPSIFLLGWVQGSGFPKATRIGKNGDHSDFEGHRYGLQSLKPALEPILVFQKPYAGRPVDSIVATGAGSLWIDGGRVATGEDTGRPKGPDGICYGHFEPIVTQGHPNGRWPANVVLSHIPPDADGQGGCQRRGTRRVKPGNGSGRCSGADNSKGTIFDIGSYPMTYAGPDGLETVDDWLCQPGCPVAALAAQSGELKSGGSGKRDHLTPKGWKCTSKQSIANNPIDPNTGTAARFFQQCDWSYELAERSFTDVQDRLAGVEPFYYASKASRTERNSGLDDFYWRKDKGAGLVRISQAEWETLPKEERAQGNIHPTVKPALSLCKYLATLLLPPPAYAPRRILCPFSGSGSEMIGAGLAGFEEVVGVEMEADYVAIAEARLRHWLDKLQLEMGL